MCRYWLLAQNTEEFVTTSSDVRGVAVCLTSLGFDELGIYYEHDVHRDRPYRVVYTPYAAFVRGTTGYRNQTRITSTTISLSQPEESLTKFPINQLTSTRCRFAWKYGIQASKAVRIAVGAEFVDTADPEGAQKFEELQYQLLDNGTQISRADTAHFPIASAFAFYPNKEFLEGLQLALNQESDETLGWLLSQTRDTEQETSINPHDISSGILGDDKVNSYTVFQAYMMGYYYSLFVDRLLDTSKLTIKTVDGAWGYRDTKFLTQMRKGQTLLKNTGMRIARTSMLSILSSLTTGEHLDSKHARRRTTPVLGLIGKRTLLVNSIIGSCDSPLAVGGFTILDCDTSGIPCDPHGLVKSGIPIPYMTGRVMQRPESMNKQAIKRLLESGPVEDFTRHIEADWEGNPDEMLLVFRYRGRRLGSVDPSDTDPLFWHSYLEPRVGPRTDDSSHWLHEAYECTINDILAGRLITPKPRTLPVLVRSTRYSKRKTIS